MSTNKKIGYEGHYITLQAFFPDYRHDSLLATTALPRSGIDIAE